ncbi:cytochrome-c oxidase, cbb3-type subunit III [Herbaspirillum sp. alder98]|uniref:cytochrome-c oxidase, cbb3-type subunit III n=1 Tax=Herbaspirillum sp. alder98 TaxID=2913096 RepID=UPI001CD85584|nr:cytochrome-c oxidase, cbb3-type subunit III [Herbaspirillum sp. alder98]MCA1323039.1 cytochrome-c oxidase, cbb3-type subunit III [Herbaspirillum sp. alder98]
MADFTSGFWNIWIIVLTVLGIVGCALLLWQQSSWKVSKNDQAKMGNTTGHVWDEDITELNNPLPRWWMWMFYLSIVFSIGYLVLYPGLGNFAGTLGWQSSGEHDQDVREANARYGPLYDHYMKQDLKLVAADPQAQAIGERLFLTYCAQCHGSDARGNKGFPNLTDNDWLHGGEPETIKETIMKGRHGVMPPMGAAVGSDRDIDNVANYVLSLSESTHDPIKAELGKSKFVACMACHSAGGRGNPLLGAPNLSDKIWLYGGSLDTIKETIIKGRDNTMPAFGEFLGEPKVHVLAAYIWSLSNRPSNAAAR